MNGKTDGNTEGCLFRLFYFVEIHFNLMFTAISLYLVNKGTRRN